MTPSAPILIPLIVTAINRNRASFLITWRVINDKTDYQLSGVVEYGDFLFVDEGTTRGWDNIFRYSSLLDESNAFIRIVEGCLYKKARSFSVRSRIIKSTCGDLPS